MRGELAVAGIEFLVAEIRQVRSGDLQDVGAVLGERASTRRPGEDARQIEHPETRQGPITVGKFFGRAVADLDDLHQRQRRDRGSLRVLRPLLHGAHHAAGALRRDDRLLELEEAIIAAKGAGGMVRSMEEWAKHPQAAAIASLPLMEIVKIGDSPPEKLPDGDRPLSGLRVLDLTRVLAGPTCARTLAEHGADVLKITAAHLPNLGYQEFDTGHGKLSAHLDLREPKDVETLCALVREADVFSQGYRPGTLGTRGFSPEALANVRPGIVFVSLCAFGHVGPWASRRGFDTVVQTVSGITSRQGELFPGTSPGPQFYPVSAIDYLTGYLMAFGAMVALARRVREGGSSLAQTGRWLVGRGQVPEAELKDVPTEFPSAELERWSMTSDTPAGRLRHLGPVVRLSETPPRWARPSVP